MMKISVDKKWVELYREFSWSDVWEGFVFILKHPGFIAVFFLVLFMLPAKSGSEITEDSIK